MTGRAHWVNDEADRAWEETVGSMVARIAAEHPDRDALVFCAPGEPARGWTYAELVADADRVAQALLGRFTPGENIAVWSPNSAEWVLLQLGRLGPESGW